MEKLITSGEDLVQLIIVLILVITAIILLVMVINIYKITNRIIAQKEGKTLDSFSFSNWWHAQTGAVPLEKEETILLHHNYDGIQELDNHLPPWWKNLFYASIVFAIAYIGIYHFWNISPLQEEEYQIAMDEGKKATEAYEAKLVNSIDEKSVKLSLKDEKVLATGKEIFVSKCAVCHGQKGEGIVGPNLTDEYWLHGGTVNDVFKTIKYGVPDKGMISWKATLKPDEIQDVSNYILSIVGTNPPNPKAPQGEKVSSKTDSTALKPVASL
jgi:cytochrome c oxidase cbb3-type subunit III